MLTDLSDTHGAEDIYKGGVLTDLSGTHGAEDMEVGCLLTCLILMVQRI